MDRLGLLTPVNNSYLSVRVCHICKLAGIDNLLELLQCDQQELMKVRGCGKRVIKDINEFFDEHSYLKEDLRFYEMATTIAQRTLIKLIPNIANAIYITYLSTKLNCNEQQ